MMRIKSLAAVLVLGLAVGACESGAGDKQTIGALGGAALGGFLGSHLGSGTGRLAATAAGVVVGGLVGNEIGKSLDRADRAAIGRTTQTSLETNRVGQSSNWVNPDSGNSGTVTPTRTYQASSGQYCREYQQTVTVGGKTEEAYGTACRQPDGTWKVVN